MNNLIPKLVRITVLLILGILCFKHQLITRNYYVDPSSTLSIANGSFTNPSNNYFTVNTIKYRGSFVTMNINVYNGFGQLVYSARGMYNVTYTFGANFIPGNYVSIAQVDGTVQAIKLVKL